MSIIRRYLFPTPTVLASFNLGLLRTDVFFDCEHGGAEGALARARHVRDVNLVSYQQIEEGYLDFGEPVRRDSEYRSGGETTMKPSYVVAPTLTQRGERALSILKRGLVYSYDNDAEDPDTTLAWFLNEIARRRRITQKTIDACRAIDHPIRDTIETRLAHFIMVSLPEKDGVWMLDPDVEVF